MEFGGVQMPCGRRAVMLPLAEARAGSQTWLCRRCSRAAPAHGRAAEGTGPWRVVMLWPLVRGRSGNPTLLRAQGVTELVLKPPPAEWTWPAGAAADASAGDAGGGGGGDDLDAFRELMASLPEPREVQRDVCMRFVCDTERSNHVWRSSARCGQKQI